MKNERTAPSNSEGLHRPHRASLARECAKLDPELEQQLAEQGMGAELEQWPEY
jgi:hypothetical protein